MEKQKKNLTKEIFIKNEIDANKGLAFGCFFSAVMMVFVWIFYLTGVFKVHGDTYLTVNVMFPILIVLLGSSIFFVKTTWIGKKYFKYFMISFFCIAIFILNVFLPKHGILMWAACLLVVNHYFSPKTSLFTYILISVLMLIGLYLSMFVGEWDNNLLNGAGVINVNGKLLDLDDVEVIPTIKDRIAWLDQLRANGDNRYLKVFLFYYLPREISLTIIANVGYAISKRSMRLLVLESSAAAEKQRMKSELNVASSIQLSVLPKEFDNKEIFGLMDAAKEVGGDFYDYFNIDDSHMAFVIGDVSGKGIPASLFMMKTETLIKSLTMSLGFDTSLIMKRSNISLCINNDANMFVTCWLGVLNVNTGELKYTNAGHNKIVVIKEGKADFLVNKPDVVLGAFSECEYREYSVNLKKGDKILLYTDGVTEAHNFMNELYGEDRLLDFACKNKDLDPKDFVLGLRKDIDKFIAGNVQFDDITILMYQYSTESKLEDSLILAAERDKLDDLLDYSTSFLKRFDVSYRDITRINTALEEVFVNIANYAYQGKYKGNVDIVFSYANDKIIFVFKDSGVPFNPLEKENPDINMPSEDRKIGGLGIYMVKKIMDDVQYDYVDNHNVLTLIKYKN